MTSASYDGSLGIRQVSPLLWPERPGSLERPRFRQVIMAALLLVLLLVAVLFDLGLVVKALLWVAIVIALRLTCAAAFNGETP